MHKDTYSSGMEKISAGDAWKQQTLAAMEDARAQATTAASPAIPSNRRPVAHALLPAGKAQKARTLHFPKALVVAAAVVALVAVPVLSGYFTEGSGIRSAAPEPQAFGAPAPANDAQENSDFSKNAPIEDFPMQSNNAQAVAEAIPEVAQALPRSVQNTAPLSLDEAMALLLKGEGYLEDASAPGGYNATEQLVVSATLYAGDSPENPHGVAAYCFMLGKPAQSDSTKQQSTSAANTFAVWVLG